MIPFIANSRGVVTAVFSTTRYYFFPNTFIFIFPPHTVSYNFLRLLQHILDLFLKLLFFRPLFDPFPPLEIPAGMRGTSAAPPRDALRPSGERIESKNVPVLVQKNYANLILTLVDLVCSQ